MLHEAQPAVDRADTVTHTASTGSIMVGTYLAWVRPRDLQLPPRHLTCQLLSHKQSQCIMRMRLGWHNLAVQQGRFGRVPRCRRRCELCYVHGFVDCRQASWSYAAAEVDREQGSGQLVDPPEDLLHFLVECPVLEPVRGQERFRQLFQPDMICRSDASTLARYIMTYRDQVLLAEALHALHERRALCLEQLRQGQLQEDLGLPVDPCTRREQAVARYLAAPVHIQQSHDWY
jgi:hypothetical protein